MIFNILDTAAGLGPRLEKIYVNKYYDKNATTNIER